MCAFADAVDKQQTIWMVVVKFSHLLIIIVQYIFCASLHKLEIAVTVLIKLLFSAHHRLLLQLQSDSLALYHFFLSVIASFQKKIFQLFVKVGQSVPIVG